MTRRAHIACATVVGLATAASWPTPEPAAPEPESPLRPADQTFLTYPEWYLVFSPDEYATYLETNAPTDFPYFGHLGQLWSSYAAVSDATSGGVSQNAGYHLMIMVIAASTSAEYGVKAAYERTVGRTTEAIVGGPDTPEDALAADVAREYVDFIEVRPWYEFDFDARLRRVWEEPVQWNGSNSIRSLERRYAMTTEYGLKALYGRLIALGTAATYEAASPTTLVTFDPECLKGATVEGLQRIEGRPNAATMPRYRGFTAAATSFASAGCAFETIAGNDGGLLLSVIAEADWDATEVDARTLFAQPILTSQNQTRFAVLTTVPRLADVLLAVQHDPRARIEHVFDY
ncbi:MAG: hypothetical protein AAGA54_12215 [Myxococcota bacterium]